ncbi:MAG: hypothetical protein Q4B60_03535 [Erysipelotrichaceae bacterium]|nr:hypothetical protein [Erysipelotrichaceae bacterium]
MRKLFSEYGLMILALIIGVICIEMIIESFLTNTISVKSAIESFTSNLM